jgi:hypothetical protein
LRDLEELLGVPKEHLEFTLWYLKEGQFAVRSDNGRVTITLKGVDLAEELSIKQQNAAAKAESKGLLPPGRVA